MPTQTEIIPVARSQSVQKMPDAKRGKTTTPLTLGVTWRGPLLPGHATREREAKLLEYYRHDYNNLFKGAIAGLIKRIQSTPWEITARPTDADYYQDVLHLSDFGRGWDSFLSKLIIDFSRFDGGAYVELIGPGDPTEVMTGRLSGLSVLDSLRCWPTGDPEYPVVYMDVLGKLHVLHTSRVVRFLDNPDAYEMSYGYGESALSRCIGAVMRDILINRYIERMLDDNPPPGIMLFKNIPDKALRDALEKMEQERNTDFGGRWGRVIRLHGTQTETMPEVSFVNFTQPPEKFDLEAYKALNVKEIALGIGLDIQDLWELTGAGIGTGTQSVILHEKSKGKAIGRILKQIERVINAVLPEDALFMFQYRDPEEDQEQANIAQTWATIALSLQTEMTPDERRQLLANQLSAFHDVLTDQGGQVIRLDDVNPDAPAITETVTAPEISAEMPPDATTMSEERSLSDSTQAFKDIFARLVTFGNEGIVSKSAVKFQLRARLQEGGESVWLDGLRDGGVEYPALDDEAQRAIAVWRAAQSDYITSFVDEIYSAKDFTPSVIHARAEMWANKSLTPLYYTALGSANKEKRWMWVFNPMKEHCTDCLKMNGQVHRMRDYIAKGILPKADVLECKGFKCGCRLVATDAKSRGNFTRGGGVLQRIIQFFRGKAAWEEGKHPRDEAGRFGAGGGGGGNAEPENGDDEAAPKKYETVTPDDPEFKGKWVKTFDDLKKTPEGQAEITSIAEYSSEAYIPINEHLRNITPTSDKKTLRHIENLDRLTERDGLDRDITVYRTDGGHGLPNAGNLSPKDFKKLQGTTIRDPGFTSTSIKSRAGGRGNFDYEIRVPKGARGAYIASESNFGYHEAEFLIGRGTAYRIVEARPGTRTRPNRLVLEIIPDA